MSPKLLLRLAAGFILIHFLGHSLGHFTWKGATDPVKKEVINQMTSHDFPFMGALRSMGDYFEGYSTIMFVVYGMSIWMLLTISTVVEKQSELSGKLLVPIGFTYLVFGVVEFIYFFPFAAGISMGAGLLIVTAIVFSRR